MQPAPTRTRGLTWPGTPSTKPLSRRGLLGGIGAGAALAGECSPGRSPCLRWSATPGRDSHSPAGPSSLDHIVVCLQENRSFDHYFGTASWAGRFGIPASYTVQDGKGGRARPYHLGSPATDDVSHDWQAMHAEWNQGAMDGFLVTGGATAIGYYTEADLPYYYSLYSTDYALCGNYFCSTSGTHLTRTGCMPWPRVRPAESPTTTCRTKGELDFPMYPGSP